MMALDLEEQEQVAELKAWWQQHGSLVVAVVLAASLTFAGWQGWRWYERSQATQAAGLYEGVARAAQAGDAKALRDATGALLENYPRTLYASMGALVAARWHFERGDLKSAKAQVQWVLEHGATDDFRDIARLRLAALLLDEKAYDDALKVLAEKHGAAYDAQYAAARGDVLVAKNDPAQAKSAYRDALDKAGGGNSGFRESVRMRLEALGG
jgi:predicted negative regulator of RcsB-dependent stress response